VRPLFVIEHHDVVNGRVARQTRHAIARVGNGGERAVIEPLDTRSAPPRTGGVLPRAESEIRDPCGFGPRHVTSWAPRGSNAIRHLGYRPVKRNPPFPASTYGRVVTRRLARGRRRRPTECLCAPDDSYHADRDAADHEEAHESILLRRQEGGNSHPREAHPQR
jgi:hypothetical protein